MATIEQKYGSLSGSFAAQLQQFSAKTQEKMDAVFQDIVIEIGESVIHLSPVDTGRFKGNWQLTINAPSMISLDNYDKQGGKTLTELVRRANELTIGQKAYIVNNLRYAIPLEYGYSQQAPAGMVRVTLSRFQQIVNDAVRTNQ